jgi:hypothetical protein
MLINGGSLVTEGRSWYGFTEDKVFGWVMADRAFCKFVLQTVLPKFENKPSRFY